jgi:hypothetical protein
LKLGQHFAGYSEGFGLAYFGVGVGFNWMNQNGVPSFGFELVIETRNASVRMRRISDGEKTRPKLLQKLPGKGAGVTPGQFVAVVFDGPFKGQ